MASPPLMLRWTLVNLFLTLAATALTLFIWKTEQDVQAHRARVRQRLQAGCPQARPTRPTRKPARAPEPPPPPPPQDAPRSGYIGDRGADITPAMRLVLEALRAGDDAVAPLRLGAQEVLPSGHVHVVNLWATWCVPCKEEMPDFKAMFARNAAWSADVRFLPILVKDAAEPGSAYHNLRDAMPAAPVKLADRALGDPFTAALAPAEGDRLFHDKLPVTLVLDCNRRVRWARFEQLTAADFADLERHVEKFRAELADTSEGAWCRQAWPGNGRCEGDEDTPAHHSFEDCGELKRRPVAVGPDGAFVDDAVDAPPEPPVEAPPDPPVVADCPRGQERTADGRCRIKLKLGPRPTSAEVRPAAAESSCGDGACEPARGESKATCCQDCACSPPLVCKPSDGGHSCQVNLK